MHHDNWEELVAKAEAGDPDAKYSLRQQIEEQMVRTTRRTVRWGVASSPLERRILLTAARVGAWPDDEEMNPDLHYGHRDREGFVRQIAEAISDEICDRIDRNAGSYRDVFETLMGGEWPETCVASCSEVIGSRPDSRFSRTDDR